MAVFSHELSVYGSTILINFWIDSMKDYHVIFWLPVLLSTFCSVAWSGESHLIVPVVMEDGAMLHTEIFLPKGKGPFPTILLRTPYSKMIAWKVETSVMRQKETWTLPSRRLPTILCMILKNLYSAGVSNVGPVVER